MEKREKSKSIIETDKRVQVTPMTSPPYKWICHLEIEMVNGTRVRASGFKIHIPDVNRSVVVTSGHCTYDGKLSSFAKTITVTFPGENPIKVEQDNLYVSPEYFQKEDKDHDYGLILLPGSGNCDEGFGWSTILQDSELSNRVITVCGFPGDKPDNTMWITGRKIHSFTANRIFYETDTFPGESGIPAYTWYNSYWTVLGIHSHGGRSNDAPRFTIQMITRFLERMNCLKPISLMSVAFPDVYIRCDGRGVMKPQSNGAGTVNCKYTPPLRWESYYIIPVEMRPSSSQELVKTVALESAHFRNVYIRLDGRGMNAPQSTEGGGKVNCQARVGMWETFVMKVEPNKGYSFRSVKFPNCYIRMDGSGVTDRDGRGGGTVNCQYCRDSDDVSAWESFFVRDWHCN